MFRFIYSIFIYIYSAGISIASIFYDKAKLLHSGRKKTWLILQQQSVNKEIIWFHCASLGEYEQGKPLIQLMRHQNPRYTFLITFFSPSGYEIKKNDADIDIAAYLPSDTLSNAKKFVKITRPKAVFFVKYEFWFNYMKVLTDNKIPFYYLSAIFRPSQYFFKPYGYWFAQQLKNCTHFFVQNQTSQNLLQSIGIKHVTITGDTRFDRVHTIAKENKILDFMECFKANTSLIVAGSTWPPDETVLAQSFSYINGSYKLVIAPHVIDKEHIENIKKLFKDQKVICYSEMADHDLAQYNVLIIDTIGLLSKVYKYANLAYIGGAFETGLHNILEAAVFGIPLFFGPKYDHFNEAIELVNRKGAFSIRSSNELLNVISQFADSPDYYQKVCQISATYVQENLGACQRIIDVVTI